MSIVTGVRATDMALRLSYDDVAVGKVEADLSQALASWSSFHASSTDLSAF